MAHIAIGSVATSITYTATASQTAFTIPFEYFDSGDIDVYQNGTKKTITTHYTITNNTTYSGGFQGGTVTLGTGATVNDKITIELNMDATRATDFATSGPFNIDTLNTWIDKVMVLLKQAFTRIDRKIGRAATDTSSYSLDLPTGVTSTAKTLLVGTSGLSLGPTSTDISGANTSAPNAAASASSAASSATSASSSATAAAASASTAAASATGWGADVIASQTQAETGTDNEKGMTPLRVKQSITANSGQASNAVFYGFKKNASTLQLDRSTVGASGEAFTDSAYDDTLFAAHGATFAINASGHLIITVP